MRLFIMTLLLLSFMSCMKSKDEYRATIEEIQREEAVDDNERSRGSNDAEGMGMDE